MNMQTVLVPLDGSALSAKIIPTLRHLLSPNQYRLILFQVSAPVVGLFGSPPRTFGNAWGTKLYDSVEDVTYARHPIFSTQVEASERAAVESTLIPTQRELQRAGFDVSIEIGFGDPSEEIVAAAHLYAVDVVAMATHGHTGIRGLLLGSVAADVLRHAGIPVLLVRPHEADA